MQMLVQQSRACGWQPRIGRPSGPVDVWPPDGFQEAGLSLIFKGSNKFGYLPRLSLEAVTVVGRNAATPVRAR